MKRKAVFLVGSPRRLKSTSHSLAMAFASRLESRGWECSEVLAVHTRPNAAQVTAVLAAVDAADLLVVVCPLYVDQLPAGTVAALETIHSARGTRTVKPRQVAGIVNSGFPESVHNDTAIDVIRRFAELDGMEWVGGLSRGMGGAISGRPLNRAGRSALGVGPALDLAADALTAGQPIPVDAKSLMAAPPMPKSMYIFGANVGWYWQALCNGALSRIRRVPRI